MCEEKRKCLKSLFIHKFPKISVIHLKRFSQTVEFSEKLNTIVDFPLIGLDMSPYGAEDIVPCPSKLYAISNHSGTTYSGHYTAYCRHLYTEIWHEYNDSLVSSISSNSLVSGNAYILFYQQEAHPKYEQRDVDSVKSYCFVADPDSTLRTVHYSAENYDMFNTYSQDEEEGVQGALMHVSETRVSCLSIDLVVVNYWSRVSELTTSIFIAWLPTKNLSYTFSVGLQLRRDELRTGNFDLASRRLGK
ncbi:unnamed protein product [Phaedon cochleariae]|uniref:ubiquitinyl hydrolase 1 n=1 Tax=Phaedon cochleariae TaxID=80249 RepID=A0A9N9SGR6_PHACE|nr:unnamed protein product [Phaedon cochleariae]